MFLRKIVKGGADRSYGIQVAKLAGVPDSVIDRAKVLAQELSEHDITETAAAEPVSSPVKKQKRRKADEVDLHQMSFFDTVTDEDVLRELKEVDVTAMTPIEAMNTLYELQSRLKKAFGLNAYGRIGKKTVNGKQDVLPAVLIGILGILFFPIVTLLLSVAAYGSVTSHLSNLSVVFKVFAAAFLLWSMIDSISTLRGMLPHPGKAAFISAVSLAYTVNAAMIAVSMINPAEDWIYYGLTILSLVLTVLLLLVILRLQNRFATRPVPDFTGEEEA